MTLIIGEIGSNFESKQDIFDSITSLKECGADIAKLQLYTHKELYGYDGPAMPGEIPREWIPEFAAHCGRVGIEFACTAFSPEGYRFIDPYVKRHKIASAENTCGPIINVVDSMNKPVLISTGGCSLDEIAFMANMFFQSEDITLMYCVSAYPAKNINLRNIVDLMQKELTYNAVGYSCHSDEWVTPVIANEYVESWCSRPLSVVEKHFKIRDMNTPDNPHSILPEEFKKMAECLSGKGRLIHSEPPHPDESDFIKYSKRRWIPELNGYYRTKKP